MSYVLFARSTTLEWLHESVPMHLERYRSGDSFTELETDDSLTFRVPLKLNLSALNGLAPPDDGDLKDLENCLIVHAALAGLSPYDARDERLWVMLTHTIGLDYCRKRWTIPSDDEKAINHIRLHFFAKSDRQVERENGLSRLWWMAHIASKAKSLSLDAALAALLFRADARAQVLERPTISQSPHVTEALLRALDESLRSDQALYIRDVNRRIMKDINELGGYRLLDVLHEDEIRELVRAVAHRAVDELG